MSMSLKIGCVLMASGNGKRFGSNKLTAEFHGKSLFSHALETIPSACLDRIVVVTQYAGFMHDVKEYHFTPIFNHRPDLGISHTIHLGLAALRDCDGALFMVADQPLLRQESVAALVEFWKAHPTCIAALAHHGKRGNPCLFPARFYPELMSLTNDHGGSTVIQQHQDTLRLFDVTEEQLLDVDTVQALEKLQQL